VKTRLILHGKSASRKAVTRAVRDMEKKGLAIEVCETQGPEDGKRLAVEACRDRVKRVIAAGGDGMVHEVVNGLMTVAEAVRPALGIVPLGTANDFARSCGIPLDLREALGLAAWGLPVTVDVGRANEEYFLNVASGGFGAEVTAATPKELKRWLGGSAYSLMGVVLALNLKSYKGTVVLPGSQENLEALVAVVGNGRQAGGGQSITVQAFIDDGLLDVLIVRAFSLSSVAQVVQEVADLPRTGEFISYHQVAWLEANVSETLPMNLDGEPFQFHQVRFETVPRALRLVVPAGCPLLVGEKAIRD
jgi:lipid kinase YegS